MIIPEANRLQEVKEYYFAHKLREIRSRMEAGENIINLGIGNPDLMPSDQTVKELVRQAVEPGNHGYQAYKGIPRLREAFAGWYLRTYGVSLDPEREILPLMGSKEGIMHISMAFLNEGDEVLVPNPGYPTYSSVARLLGAKIRYYELSEENNWYPDLKKLEVEGLSNVKIMWVNYPHMPTGKPASAEIFQQLVDFGKANNILICHDNPYSMVLTDSPKSILSATGSIEVALELNSLSKSHNMAGWRVGMLGGKKDYIDTILKVKSNMDSGMFRPLQQAAAQALENSFEWHSERNGEYKLRRQIVWQLMESLKCSFDRNQNGMFIWAKIPDWVDSAESFSDRILDDTSVFITPGSVFGSQGDRYIRASLCTPRQRLQEALTRILEYQLTNA